MSAIALDSTALVKVLEALVPGFPVVAGSPHARLLEFLEWKRRQMVRLLIPTPVVAEAMARFQRAEESG